MPTTSLELLTSAVQTKTNNHPFITNARNARATGMAFILGGKLHTAMPETSLFHFKGI